jgi:hypothetical protein
MIPCSSGCKLSKNVIFSRSGEASSNYKMFLKQSGHVRLIKQRKNSHAGSI